MNIGKRLKELREAAGLSQTQLAKITGVSRNAVSQWEAGTTQPSTKRLTLLSRALNVPIDQIMTPGTEARELALEAASRLFDQTGVTETTVEAICEAAGISRGQFDAYFGSLDAIIYEVARLWKERAFTELRRRPPKYGTLATRLKYLLLHFYVHDLAHAKLVAALHASSWRWSETRERENNRNLLEFHDVVIALLDEAAEQGEIDPGNYRAASGLILATYQLGLRKAILERHDPDNAISLIEPQLAIILNGFDFRVVPGFSDNDD